jgi:hypothetical protein
MSTPYPISIGEFSDYSYQMTRATGDWLVMGIGADPWILAAYNFATGEWRSLKEVPGLGSYKTFQLHKLEDGTIIVVSEEIAGDPSSVTYWLFDDGNFTSFAPMEPINNTIDNRHDIVKNYPQVGGFSTVHYEMRCKPTAPWRVSRKGVLFRNFGLMGAPYYYSIYSMAARSHL